MKEIILSHLDDPRQLERIYRQNKLSFKRSFDLLYPEITGSPVADFWNERLHYESDEVDWGSYKDLFFVIIASLIAGLIAKVPDIFNIAEEPFYSRNAGLILFPALSAYFAWKNKLPARRIVLIFGAFVSALCFINFLPFAQRGDTFILSCIHLIVVEWSILGFAFTGELKNANGKRLAFLKYNGDLLVITALIVIASGILSAITIGLFSLIGFRIERFYFQYIVISGLPAAPIVGTYLIQSNPQLVGKVSPVIAKIFSPLVLAMLIIYLVAIVISGKNPYNDREFLIIFNILLIGVMSIIFFSIGGTASSPKRKAEIWMLALLSAVTIVVNGIALSAIVFRIAAWGASPNRTAVLGNNVLILVNLLLVSTQLFKVASGKKEIVSVEKAITGFLPVYSLWAAIVSFLFPFIFGFR
ncbi:MAG: hypothetical protein JST42_22400 [Bacteroidetes bacterium]|nr:hypothetical protein [Bacteroidota bacterium]